MNPKPIILYRGGLGEREEEEAARRYFDLVRLRSRVPANSLVIGRYSVLPNYDDLEGDLDTIGSFLINTYRQHRYIADLGNWYRDLSDLTPKTWPYLEAVDELGPFVLKGETNSKKFLWDTHMYAKNVTDAYYVRTRLEQDGLVGDQQVYVRRFVPLKTYMTGLRGIPVTHEYRVFVLDGQVVEACYYWSNYYDELPNGTNLGPPPPMEFLNKVIERVGKNARFYVVDVALTESGEWIVIELNDGQMSGLSMMEPDRFYKRLQEVLRLGGCYVDQAAGVQ